MKRKLSIILSFVMMLSALFAIHASAANYPGASSSAYIEFTAQQNMNVYKDTGCKTRGTCTPSKAYNASIAKNDKCYIYQIASSYIKVNYPTSSGRRTGYIKRSDLFSSSSAADYIASAAKKVNVSYAGGGYIAKGDRVWQVSPKKSYSGYAAVIYDAKSGKRAYKMGYITTSDLNAIKNKTTPNTKTDTQKKTGGLMSPLKGGMKVTGSSATTHGYKCDYTAKVGTPIYAPCDGTVNFKQTSYKGYLISYGNWIEFTSNDKSLSDTYYIKMGHLNAFNNVSLKIPSTKTKRQSSYGVNAITKTLDSRNVKKGELLGYSGEVGNAYGPHLHVEVKKNGTWVNPQTAFISWN